MTSNVLVTGASGVVGYGVLRSLKNSGENIRLIGTSIYSDSIANAFSDEFVLAPFTTDSSYIGWLLEVIKEYSIDVAFPCIEDDVYSWTDNSQIINETGVHAVLNNPVLVSLCRDKWNFYNDLNSRGSVYAIDSSISTDFDQIVTNYGLPFILKPRVGYASKGIVKVKDRDTFLQHRERIGDYLMVQPYVGNDDEEYSVSAFGDGRGDFSAYITLRRKLATEGFTEKAQVVEADGMREALEQLCQYYKPLGPTNFQFRNHEGVLKLLEINPRVSSSTSIRSAFGYNETAMALNYYLHGIQPKQPTIRKGKVVRYIEDFVFL